MRDQLAALRREHHELTCRAERECADGYRTWAEQHKADADEVLKKIEKLEANDGVMV